MRGLTAEAEVYDPATDRLTRLSATTYDARSFRTVTPVGALRVLVARGYDDAVTPTDQAVVMTIPPAAGS